MIKNRTKVVSVIAISIATVLIGALLFILMNNTKPGFNAQLTLPNFDKAGVVCKLRTGRKLSFPSTTVWREDFTIHVTHPDISFAVYDPNGLCTVKL